MNNHGTSSASFFEAKYQADADPWHFATDPYEQARYDAVMRALEGNRYSRAFEPGCSVGALTGRLAAVCDAVDACDFSSTAAAQASTRCAALPHVSVRCAPLIGDEPWAEFDLVVLCEIGYYFTQSQWASLIQQMVRTIRPGTVVLASHWLGYSQDHVQSGEAVHWAMQHPLLKQTLSERHSDEGGAGFLLERWVRQA